MDLAQSTGSFTAYVEQMTASNALPPGATIINAVVVVEVAYEDAEGVLRTQPFLLCPMGSVSRIWLRGLLSQVRKRMFRASYR